MASDDDEELVPEAVTEYHFVDKREEPVCFSRLPVLWSEHESVNVHKDQVFLHGKTDDGLQKVYKQVIAWKVEIEGDSSSISVLSKDKKWLKLLKPRKAYEDTIRKILITLECLLYLKGNPVSSEKTLWEHLHKAFSQFEIKAAEDDLLGHLSFIQSMIERDKELSKSQLLEKLILGLSKKKVSDKIIQKSDFINDNDDEVASAADGDESDEDVECFDTVCAICDNGGELLCCEGDCLRSFHAIKDTGFDSHCKTLGYTRAQVQAMQNFLCPNCAHKKHQCFACGKLGCSDKASGREVFRCISASCGRFYHPHCVATLMHPTNENEALALQKMISSGESFICPTHKCVICGQFEDKENVDLQFAICRRCPTSYHRKCLPREISFGDSEDEDDDVEVRAWDGLIPHRILIYCLKHEIDNYLGTPARNHIFFPGVQSKMMLSTESSRINILGKRKPGDLSRGKMPEKVAKTIERGRSSVEANDKISGSTRLSVKKMKTADVSKKDMKGTRNVSILDKKKSSLSVEKIQRLVTAKSVKKNFLSSKDGEADPSIDHEIIDFSVDEETRKRVMLLVKKSPSSTLTVEELFKKKKLPAVYAHSNRNVGKSITQGKVDGSIEAVRAALQKFEKGCRIEDAKAVCGPDILNQILSWRKKFKVYLSPFLHGVRYSSYGRHFTKVDKLEEIVERLHWYVQNGDTIVDFCCGANDFSLLMKRKLEATGKKCSFKNFDLFPPKNDFCFEQRDWFRVQSKDLPTGSQLIMGLNPPFGVNAALANKFIDKALEFKPKILILIVPKETQRLDEKPAAYNLVWQDEEKLSGKSFYLPGSVDVNENQIEQWNVNPPLLYLWSRPDWTMKHMTIALKYGHLPNSSKMGDVAAGKESPYTLHPENDSGCHIRTDLREEQSTPAVCQEEKVRPKAQDHSSKLQHDVDGKDKVGIGKHRGIGGSQKSQVKVNKISHKKMPKKQDEARGKQPTNDDASDMSISPLRGAGTEQAFDLDVSIDAPFEGATVLTDFNRPIQGFGSSYRSLANGDIDALERRYSRDDAGNLERQYGGRDFDNLDGKYAPSTWNGPFPSNLYDLPSDPTGRMGFESRYGNERHPGYARDSPLRSSSPYVGEDRQMRTDIPSTFGMYGLQASTDVGVGRRTPEPGAASRFGQSGSLTSPYGFSVATSTLTQTGSFSSAYGLSGTALGSSAMNRYAPRLDELGLNNSAAISGHRPPFTSGSQNHLPGHRPPSGGWLDD